MRILCPLRRSASLRHHSALSPPSQTAAASSKLTSRGLCAIRALSRMQMNSAYAPNLNPLVPKTWSPTPNSLTAAPVGVTSRAVRPGDRHGANLDEDLVLHRDRPLDLLESQNVWRPVPVVHN